MERIFRISFVLTLVITILTSARAFAGVTFVPSTPSEGDDQVYPVSRFGEAPADPVRGYRADWPKQVHRANRVPAGMVFEDDPGPSRSTAGTREKTANQVAAETAADRTTGTRRLERDLPLPKSPSQAQPQELVPDRTKGIQEISIIAGDLGFFPKTFFVSRDVPVRLFVTGASKKPLCIMMDSFQVRRQVSSQRIEEITFTPNVPGQYRFYCPMNGMEGTMVVKELASSD